MIIEGLSGLVDLMKLNVSALTYHTRFLILPFIKGRIHSFYIWPWSSNPKNIKRCCYWGKIRTLLPRFTEKINIYCNEVRSLKSRLKSVCEKHSEINLSKIKNIAILKQDKGTGFVILDTTKYTEKCMLLLDTKRFKKFTTDFIAATERKIKTGLEKNKIWILRAGIEKITSNRLSISSILQYSLDTQDTNTTYYLQYYHSIIPTCKIFS